MIKINTSHILPDTPYLLEGTEPADVLELPPDADPPLETFSLPPLYTKAERTVPET